MKTRREFFKTLAGSVAVLAACVVAPKSLMAKEEKWKGGFSGTFHGSGGDSLPYATSGYAQIGDHTSQGTVTATATNGDDTWQVMEFTQTDGWRNYGRREGDSHG